MQADGREKKMYLFNKKMTRNSEREYFLENGAEMLITHISMNSLAHKKDALDSPIGL